MKPDNSLIDTLKATIQSFSINEYDNNIIYVDKNILDSLKNIRRTEPLLDDSSNLIKKIIISNQHKGHISIRKITEIYNKFALKNSMKILS